MVRCSHIRSSGSHARATMALVAIGLLVYFCSIATACASDVTAPRETPCVNPLKPLTFRIVLNSGDTLPRMTNHYLQPHRSADTLRARLFDDSGTITIPWNWGP